MYFMPGHSRAVLNPYHSLSCTGIKQPVPDTWGVLEEVLCAGNDDVFTLLENVLDKIIELFPSKVNF
jgi:hexosaminidase